MIAALLVELLVYTAACDAVERGRITDPDVSLALSAVVVHPSFGRVHSARIEGRAAVARLEAHVLSLLTKGVYPPPSAPKEVGSPGTELEFAL